MRASGSPARTDDPADSLLHPPFGGIDMNARGTAIRAVIAGLVVAGACVQTMPRRVSGSDVTLPEASDRAFMRSLTSRCNESDTTTTRRDPTSRCGGTPGDTVRSTSDPIAPPPQKTP
jgi:hypothetical protein